MRQPVAAGQPCGQLSCNVCCRRSLSLQTMLLCVVDAELQPTVLLAIQRHGSFSVLLMQHAWLQAQLQKR